MEGEVCKHNQKGYCKFGGEFQKFHENKICIIKGCSSKGCRKRHPTLCKYFRENNVCRYGEECAFLHIETVNKNEVKILSEDIEHIKAEIGFLKNTVISLLDINKEGKIIKKMIESLKVDIENIKDENKKIVNKIIKLEEECEESEFEVSLCKEENEVIENGGSKSPLFKCNKCQFWC